MFYMLRKDLNRYILTAGSKGSFLRKLQIVFFNFGFVCTSIYRINNFVHRKFKSVPILSRLSNLSGFLGLKFSQLLYGISIPHTTQIGKGLFLSHNGPIIINPKSIIGNNCNIGPMVVIGTGKKNGFWGVPKIGDQVWIGPGAKIFGDITIGNNVAIGANAVVNSDIPDNAVVGGIPAKIINYNGSSEYIYV
jgi:serine O-acetyltransferase